MTRQHLKTANGKRILAVFLTVCLIIVTLFSAISSRVLAANNSKPTTNSSQITSSNPSSTTSGEDPTTKPPTETQPEKPIGNCLMIKEGLLLPEVKAGESIGLLIPLVNISNLPIDKVQVQVELPEKIYSNVTSLSQVVYLSGGVANVRMSLSADEALESGVYPIKLSLSFAYDGQPVTETISLNLRVNGKNGSANTGKLFISSYSLDRDTVSAGSDFQLNVVVQNLGEEEYSNLDVKLDGLDTAGITVNRSLDTQLISKLPANGTATITYPLTTNGKMETGNQILTVSLGSGEKAVSSKVFVPVKANPKAAEPSEPVASSKPLIVIESYDFGGTAVTGGQVFPLQLNLKNTSQTSAIENLKMTISSVTDDTTGGAFTPANSSNTFYIASVPAGGSFQESIDLLTKADAPPKSYGLQVAFSYEAVLDGKRETIEATETIAIPVIQQDRFEVQGIQCPETIFLGEPLVVSTQYVNKGKGTVYNFSISVEGTNFTTAEKNVYIGNVESGNSDSYELTLNPEQVGKAEGKITFSYEDANGNVKESVQEFSAVVEEMPMPEDPNMGMEEFPEEQKGMPVWGWIVIVLLLLGVAAFVAIRLIKRVKAAKAKLLDLEDDYDDLPAEEESDEEKTP